MMFDKERLERAVFEILCAIGEDPSRDGLLETPKRVASMYEEIFSGLHMDPGVHIKTFHEEHSNLVVVKDIPVYSMCEHHLLPFIGVAHVAYIPSGNKVLGLSKIARIVDTIARKPQLQERLCNEVCALLMETLEPHGVSVLMESEHLCMTMRGIQKPGCKTVTSVYEGVFKTDIEKRNEVLSLVFRGGHHG